MDLNYLFHRQQIERTRSETAESVEARTAHEQLAKRYEDQIETLTSEDYHFPKESKRLRAAHVFATEGAGSAPRRLRFNWAAETHDEVDFDRC